MKITINKKISFNKDSRPYIVAEISGNHNGSKKLFLKHIREAHKNGADMIKIQTYEPDDITIKNTKLDTKIKKGIWKGKNLWDLYNKAQTPFTWHADAFKLAKKLKITLFSTPFSIRALKFLKKFNPKIYKISSFEITDFNLINEIAKTKKPIIISTGSSTFNEIKSALKIIERHHSKIILLHCVSGYPTPIEEANINSIKFLQTKFKDYYIGLSDHTKTIDAAIGSVSLGAKLIEKHFKISEKIKSEDSKFSITGKELKILKGHIINIHKSLGNFKKNIQKTEKNNRFFRRSIYSIKNIKKGEKFNEFNIGCFRPKLGISASEYYHVIGKKSKKNINKFNPIKKKNF